VQARNQSQAPTWSAYAYERLAAAGFRRGGARSAVVEFLAHEDCARSAVEIEEALAGGARGAARASVYRVLEQLESIGLISRFDVGDSVARYEAVYPDGLHHHHHMLCGDCGELFPFRDDELERAIRRVSKRVDFDVSAHDVLLRGLCAACREG
jgi:Fur family ferric uptake transcriptional regulator